MGHLLYSHNATKPSNTTPEEKKTNFGEGKMNSTFGIFVMLAAFASVFGKDTMKDVDLAEELAMARQDVAKAREETDHIIKRENERLLKNDEELRKQGEELRLENKRLLKNDEELRKQDEELRREIRELRRADEEMKKSMRQRDGISDPKVLRKMMQGEIKSYLKSNEICVAGNSYSGENLQLSIGLTTTFQFGHVFPRIPSFTVSLAGVRGLKYKLFIKEIEEVTNSTARVYVSYTGQGNPTDMWFWLSWMACL